MRNVALLVTALLLACSSKDEPGPADAAVDADPDAPETSTGEGGCTVKGSGVGTCATTTLPCFCAKGGCPETYEGYLAATTCTGSTFWVETFNDGKVLFTRAFTTLGAIEYVFDTGTRRLIGAQTSTDTSCTRAGVEVPASFTGCAGHCFASESPFGKRQCVTDAGTD
jgi:hypothetical protein